MDRRTFLKYSGASLAIWPTHTLATKGLNGQDAFSRKKVVFVLLRGALDPLHTIIPMADKDFAKHRPTLSKVRGSGVLPLTSQFALHPTLTTLFRWYKDNQLLPIVAVGTGYPSRSHFDGQDYLESGLTDINHTSGWLGRAVSVTGQTGIAISQSLPIIFRSPREVKTWYPSNLKSADTDIYDDLIQLYQRDDALSAKLQEGISTKELVNVPLDKRRSNKFVELASSCGQLMNAKHGPQFAMLELGGWDTHNNQSNRLARKLNELNTGLEALEQSLAKTWQDTVIVVATEFGRTVKENGTGGTDHGTGSCLFMAGGPVAGGRVLGKWPGLACDQLFENRDLKPTSNHFSWFSALLSEHCGLTAEQLKTVFPNHSPYITQLLGETKSAHT